MFITNFLNYFFNKKCSHDKVALNLDYAYCPDCGKMIKNEWYITRCACCGVKLKTTACNDEIMPQNNFCSNCGSHEFTVEKLEKINFIDINYAVLIKKAVENNLNTVETTQYWQEKNNEQPKLLVQYL